MANFVTRMTPVPGTHYRYSARGHSHLYRSCLSIFFTALMFLSACSNSSQEVEDLAVAKIPTSQLQATAFLPLNADKPGTPVYVERYLVPGKHTIVFYFSPYDQTCVNMEEQLVQLCQARADLAVRTVNINRPEVEDIDWQSPIIQDELIQTLPYFVIYDPAQTIRAKGRSAYAGVKQWLQELR